MLKKSLGFGLLLISGMAFATDYQIDPNHSAAEFSVRHMMVSTVRGQLSKITGTISYDPKNPPASQVNVSIDATTIDTRVQRRDADLKGANFFEVDKFPTMTFQSTKVWKEGNKLMMQGDLTMHGVTKPVTLNVDGPSAELKDDMGNLHIGATATGKISRKDWGLTWNKAIEAGGVTVSDEVAITLDIEAIHKSDKPAATSGQ